MTDGRYKIFSGLCQVFRGFKTTTPVKSVWEGNQISNILYEFSYWSLPAAGDNSTMGKHLLLLVGYIVNDYVGIPIRSGNICYLR